MTQKWLIKNAQMVNEGQISAVDVLISGAYIEKIAPSISNLYQAKEMDAQGQFLLPGCIDDQVHFREPGLTHKATIESESKAALAGGITSFIEMPNTQPQTTTLKDLEDKFWRAQQTSWANYSYMFGGTNDNLNEILKLDPTKVAALKLFLGSSTGNMLVDNPDVLREIFSNTPLVIAVHCEDEATIHANLQKHLEKFGPEIPIACHPDIRSAEACYISSSTAIALAKETGARLHVFHLSTAKETHLFTQETPLKDKKITAEVCVHHLFFSDKDYANKGTHIKWNPAVKSKEDQAALWAALNDDRIDIVATDHAPHTLEEKNNSYTQAPSGGPLVQHALCSMIDAASDGKIRIEKVVQKMCHNPAILFDIEKRGFLREGYFADLVLVDPNNPWTVSQHNLLYKCGWSPFEGHTFQSKVMATFLNGTLAYANDKLLEKPNAMRLTFNRNHWK